MNALYAIVGAGGFGREVMPIAADGMNSRDCRSELVFVSEEVKDESVVNGHRLIGKRAFLDHQGPRFYCIAIATSVVRSRLDDEFLASGCEPFEVRALNAHVTDSVIGPGAIISPFVTIQGNAKVGRHFHANIYSYVAHDCVIGDYVTLAPNVACNGNVIIEDNAYIGTGAIILPGAPNKPLRIGQWAKIGAGAVVTGDVFHGTTVTGIPAKPVQHFVSPKRPSLWQRIRGKR